MESTYCSLGDFSFDKEVTVSRAGTSSTVDSVMITPQEKLYRFESRAQSLADAQQVGTLHSVWWHAQWLKITHGYTVSY